MFTWAAGSSPLSCASIQLWLRHSYETAFWRNTYFRCIFRSDFPASKENFSKRIAIMKKSEVVAFCLKYIYTKNILSFWTRFQNWGYVELREIDFPFKKFAVWSGCIAFADYLLENILGVYSFCCETYAELKQHLTLRLQSAIFWKSSGFCFSVHVCSTFTMKLNFVLFCVLSYRKSIHS